MLFPAPQLSSVCESADETTKREDIATPQRHYQANRKSLELLARMKFFPATTTRQSNAALCMLGPAISIQAKGIRLYEHAIRTVSWVHFQLSC
jgi:hypothetical protein